MHRWVLVLDERLNVEEEGEGGLALWEDSSTASLALVSREGPTEGVVELTTLALTLAALPRPISP